MGHSVRIALPRSGAIALGLRPEGTSAVPRPFSSPFRQEDRGPLGAESRHDPLEPNPQIFIGRAMETCDVGMPSSCS